MAAKVASTPQLNGVPKKSAANTRPTPVKKPAAGHARSTAGGGARQSQSKAAPVPNKAASVAGGENGLSNGGITSPYAIMANRIANRVAEMAETFTFVER